MGPNGGQVKNLKPFVKGDPRINRGEKRGPVPFRFDRAIEKALQYKTPQKLRAAILKKTGQDVLTYEEAVLAVLVANAANGSARHIEILFKLKGDFARAEAEARRAVERDEGKGENGSTLLIKVVRKSEATEPHDITPENDAPAG